jgi:MoaA/NifB/PqqE/SkfB family radical SAM enzyme
MAEYSTDKKVRHITNTEEDVNETLCQHLGADFVEYRKAWDAANQLDYVADFPLFIQLDVDQSCNFKCPHCMLADDKGVRTYFSRETIEPHEFDNILREASQHQCPSISLQGTNEPLLSRELETQIKKAKASGFLDIMINSNGSALTEKRARSLLGAGLTRLRFSIDASTEDTFKKVRVGGDFAKVRDNILRFMRIKKEMGLKLPLVGVSFCVLADNSHEKDDFLAFWANKVDFVSIQRFTAPTPDKYWEKFYPDSVDEEPFEGFKCPQPFQRLVIRNRDITPCCTWFSRELSLGEVGKVSLAEAWRSEKMNELRELHRRGDWHKNATCKKCVNAIFKESKTKHG